MKIRTSIFLPLLLSLVFTLGSNLLYRGCKRSVSTDLPKFTFVDLSGANYSSKDLPVAENYVVICYSVENEGARREIDDILTHPGLFKNTSLLFVSVDQLDAVKKYSNYLQAGKFKGILVRASKTKFQHYFGPTELPSTYVYNSRQELINKINGPATAQLIYDSFQH